MTDIEASYLLDLYCGARTGGHPIEPLLARASIDPALLDDPEGRVTFPQLSMFYKALWIATGDEYLCFTKHPCKLGTFRLMVDILSRQKYLEGVLHDAARFYRLTRDDTDFRVEQVGEQARVVVQMATLPVDRHHMLQEYMMMAWQQYLCWLAGIGIPWQEITFDHPEPDYCSLYPRLFTAPTLFSQSECSFSFDRKLLRLQVSRKREEVAQFLKVVPLPLLSPMLSSTAPFSVKVRQIFSGEDLLELPSLGEVAERLDLNARTVHRKLVDEGTSYQQLKSRYRAEVAMACLVHRNMSTRETSEFLGFSEPSSFCRFFKNETGLAPSRYAVLGED